MEDELGGNETHSLGVEDDSPEGPLHVAAPDA